MTTTALDRAFAALTAALQVEREAATGLLQRLTKVRRLLEDGGHGELPDGLTELELAAARLDAAGRHREQIRRDLCGALGIEEGPCTLARLAARAPAPWGGQLTEHRSALRELAGRIEREAEDDQRQAEQALDALHRLLGQAATGGTDVGGMTATAGERRLVADLDLATLVTEVRVREFTYEAIIAVTRALGSHGRLAVLAGRTRRST